ncbi:11-oxo-beta-amyrin 30-oxidase, partial [Bienertia sinuspersici]
MTIEARSKPMLHFSNDHLPRVNSFFHQTVTKYGRKSFIWNGPVPLINITEPQLIREVFMKIKEFPKEKLNPLLVKKVASGLVMLEGQEAQRRKLLNPAFHMDKLK